MNILIEDYNMYEKKEENKLNENDLDLIFEIFDSRLDNFPFMNSTVFISLRKLKNGYFFIADSSKKKIITFSNMSKLDLLKIKSQKTLILSLLETEKTKKQSYEFDIKIIK